MSARSERGAARRGRGGLLVALLLVLPLLAAPTARAEGVGSFVGAETLAAGGAHTCAILATGGADCWGDDTGGQLDAPAGAFVSIASGGAFSCGVRDDGTLACWGDDAPAGVVSGTPSGQFLSVAAGEGHACAVRIDGALVCWGSNSFGQATPPTGAFLSVAAGVNFSCGLRSDGELACWGADGAGQATPPTGEFTAVAAGGGHACAIRADGTVLCWGENSEITPPAGEFRSIATGSNFTCGIDAGGEIECWGVNPAVQTTPPSGRFRSVSGGGLHACAVRDDGETVCWGSDASGQLDGVPSGSVVGVPLVAVGFNSHYSCAVRLDGDVQCWGVEFEGMPINPGVPAGPAVALAGGIQNTCMIRSDDGLECWGRETSFGEEAKPPTGAFRVLASASSDYCAIRLDGELACWGDPQPAELNAPSGRFRTIAAGQTVFCAIHVAGTLACWGTPIGVEDDLLTEVPSGEFRAVAVEPDAGSACAIRDDGTVTCWGGAFHTSPIAPIGTFRDLAGACPLNAELKLTCGGEGEIPAGHVRGAAALGERHSCALLVAGTIDCWGENEYGQVQPEFLEATLPRAVVGTPYSGQLEITFEDPVPTVSITAGELPPGLGLCGCGLIVGTPTTAGDFEFEAAATNGAVPPATVEETLEVVGAPLVIARPGAEATTSGASIDAEVNPQNLPAEAWFEYWPASGSSAAAQRTPVQSLPAGVASVPLSAELTGLSSGTEYDYRAVAENEVSSGPVAGETVSLRTASPAPEPSPSTSGQSPPTSTPPAAEVPSAPPPVAGKSVDVQPAAGVVTTQCPGQGKPQKLASLERIPLGCTVDTRGGTVTLTSVKAPGETESAQFWGGVFKVGQEGGAHPETVLTLVGPLECAARTSAGRARASALVDLRGKGGGRSLWGSGEGNFKTVGHLGAASVRGTIWFVGDRCDGTTFFKVRRGTVWVRDFVKGKTVVLQKGQSYVASPRSGRAS